MAHPPEPACDVAETDSSGPENPSVWRKLRRIVRRVAWLLLTFLVFCTVVVLIGLVPVNNDFQNVPDSEPGVDVYITSSAVHADVIVPIRTAAFGDFAEVDWEHAFPAADFPKHDSETTHMAIGWGDKGFYLETPRWADLKISTALHALIVPSATCVHVDRVYPERMLGEKKRVRISHAQYRRLVAFVQASTRSDSAGRPILIRDEHYGINDAFYEGTGNYWLFYTCNTWVGRSMVSTGIRTGWLTPLPKTMFLYLDD